MALLFYEILEKKFSLETQILGVVTGLNQLAGSTKTEASRKGWKLKAFL